MASSHSLDHHHSTPSYHGGPSGQDNSPLSALNLGILKTLTEKRTTRDGQPQKRRGPKPDSKPALTRRQELNRQAQRTHRERKELYIKALEDEVLRLKEVFSNMAQDKDRLVEENRQLRELLAQNGLGPGPMTGPSSVMDDSVSNPSTGYSSSVSMAGSYVPVYSNASAFTPPPMSATTIGHRGDGISPNSATSLHSQFHQPPSGQGNSAVSPSGAARQPNRNPKLDYEQIGIDFVLTLEKPCMSHMPWLLERNAETGGNEPCGHALMASCPPQPFHDLTPDIPFGNYRPLPPLPPGATTTTNTNHHSHTSTSSSSSPSSAGRRGNGTPTIVGPTATMAAAAEAVVATAAAAANGLPRTWELSKGDLATLLDLSRRLDLDGEITPVMAWGMVLAHPRLGELGPADFARLTEELGGKVRCYG
ncbi:hypothetical protein VTK26DRAFT_2928 [Humicola hyalothermophila]